MAARGSGNKWRVYILCCMLCRAEKVTLAVKEKGAAEAAKH